MNRNAFAVAFAIGLVAVAWVGAGFVGASWLALAMTCAIAAVYVLGAFELQQFRAASATLAAALDDAALPCAPAEASEAASALSSWLARLHPSLQHPVRQRIEGARAGLPAPALTPYLVGLLVMLGMLGTFLGMVVTFKGAVFALEGSTDLQAIRAALAAPIKGLGLSFGTSVAGVAASAMLGLMSALSRRERLALSSLLDSRIATKLRPFSEAFLRVAQREQTDAQALQALQAVQAQGQALPAVVQALQTLADGIERRQQQLGEQLLAQQSTFHREASAAYAELAQSVGRSLQDSLSASARIAGDSLQPVLQSALSEIAAEVQRAQRHLAEATQAQFDGLSDRFADTARTVSEGWTTALQTHAQTSTHTSAQLGRTLQAFTDTFAQRAEALVADVAQAAARSQAAQADAEQRKLDAWMQALATQSAQLGTEWQRLGVQTAQQQEAICQALQVSARDAAERTRVQASQTLHDIAQLLNQSQALVQSRAAAEAQWAAQHGERMDQLASLWRTELAALRAEESARGDAAVARLGELQSAVTQHLATLGTALEAPMTRLLQTAAEVPQSASEVIAQLRTEMAQISARDTQSLQERAEVMGQIRTLLDAIHRTSGEQRASIEALAASATSVMDQASRQFADTLGTQASKTEHLAAHVVSSAIELSSLGEAFRHGVQTFTTTNDKLAEGLQRLESAIQQSMARSDEQLAYYVAQAREVIDLSISAQQGIVEDLRQLRGASTASAAAGGAA